MPRWLRLVAVAALLVAASCDNGNSGRRADDDPTPGSSAFAVGPPPAGYQLAAAGKGTQNLAWGDDSFGNSDPFTVLTPVGRDATSRKVVVVSVTGFEGFQGKLDQAAHGPSQEAEHFEIDGREAIFTPGGVWQGETVWADLVAVRGDDLAVRVTAPAATRAELAGVLRAVRPAGNRRHAPEVPEPPDGMRVVGSIDADIEVAIAPEVIPGTRVVPGTEVAHAIGWARDWNPRSPLAVITLPGWAADIDALAGFAPFARSWGSFDLRSRDVGGRPGAVVDLTNTEYSTYRRRAVFRQAPWGDVVMVSAAGETVPSEDELVAMAASVREASAEEWERYGVEARGGPGLNPDGGAIELARGRAGGLGWLFQAEDTGLERGEPDGVREADHCLKLSNGRRACARYGGSTGTFVRSAPEMVANSVGGFDFPGFTVIATRIAGAQVRVHAATGSATGTLYRIPGSDFHAAVVFANAGSRNLGCDELPPVLDDVARIEVLDASGSPVGCVDGNT